LAVTRCLKQLYHSTHQWLEAIPKPQVKKQRKEKSHKKYQLALSKLTDWLAHKTFTRYGSI